MTNPGMTRREWLQAGSASAALLAMLANPRFVFPAEEAAEELVPFLDMPQSRPGILDWETLDSWLTPQDQVFTVSHYGTPEVASDQYRLEVSGLVEQSKLLTLADVQALPRSDQLMTLECAGNGSSKGFMGAVFNSRWTGTRLLPLLESCGIKDDAIEVAFIGYDEQEETLRKDSKRELTFRVPFGRSLSLADVRRIDPLLAYERNGEPLAVGNGAPLRLIVPGWYGIANVKWLRRIQLRNTRYMGRYMARDYVTVRGERNGDDVVFTETSVGKLNLKSIIARVTRGPLQNGQVPCKAYGAVWGDGTEITRVEVQVDGGEWRPAKLDAEPQSQFSWTFFSIDLGGLPPGKHTLVSRGVDARGRSQPAATDDEIALKKTYWEAYAQWPREIELAG